MNLPNSLTVTRIFLVPLLVVVLLTTFEGRMIFGVPKELVGAAIFGVASLTDWLDGYLREDPTRSDRALRVALAAARRRVRHPRLFGAIDRTRRLLRRALSRLPGGQRLSAPASSNSAS